MLIKNSYYLLNVTNYIQIIINSKLNNILLFYKIIQTSISTSNVFFVAKKSTPNNLLTLFYKLFYIFITLFSKKIFLILLQLVKIYYYENASKFYILSKHLKFFYKWKSNKNIWLPCCKTDNENFNYNQFWLYVNKIFIAEGGSIENN